MDKKLTNDQLVKIVDKAVANFKGNINHLESAIGMLAVARFLGWRPLLLIHDKKTIRRNEKILDVKIRDALPGVGEKADKSIAWNLVQNVSSFWKAVRGEIKEIRNPNIQ